MANTDTLLLSVARDYSVKIGLPPRNHLDSFNARAAILGKVGNVSHVACSPGGELFCIRGGDLYRGPMPSKKDVDWFSVALKVGTFEWNRVKLFSFHPNGDLYCTTVDGELYKGPQPDNEHVPWLYERAQKIGSRIWNQCEAMFFNPEGILHVVHNSDRFYKGPPPTDENCSWLSSSELIGEGGWRRLTHFMSFDFDGKLWSVDKYNGNIYKGDPPVPKDTNYLLKAEYLGWSYQEFKFFSFTKDKTIKSILCLEFLTDEGEKVSEHPEVLEEKVYDNRGSSVTLKHNFMLQKTIKQSSSFTHDHGFTIEMESEVTVKTGIPFFSEGEMKVSMNMSTTHNWSFNKTNETEVTFSSSTDVELEAGKAIRMVASVIKAEIDVPYKAKARTLFGSEVEIGGMWKGISHYHLLVKQMDLDK